MTRMITVRVTDEEHALWIQEADGALSAWIRENCNARLRKNPSVSVPLEPRRSPADEAEIKAYRKSVEQPRISADEYQRSFTPDFGSKLKK